MRRWLLLLFPFFLYCADYDYIVIGSSPIPLFEALYQHSLGKRVLVLEGACCLGGAWQSIDICGVQHADLGCHMIGNNEELANFFEVYAGCSIVSLDTPKDFSLKSGKNGFYFAHGCYELMNHLQEMIQSSSIDLLFNQKAYSATVDTANNHVVVQTKDHVFTTEKVVITPYTRFCDDQVETCTKIKFHHLYLLIHDPTPPRFTYSWGIPSTTRMMNITDFVDLENTGMQLIIFQTHNEDTLQNGSTILQQLKEKFMIHSNAYIVKSQSYTYEQWPANHASLQKEHPTFFEMLETSHLIKMTDYISRWKMSIIPYTQRDSKRGF